ncbi:pyridoxamine 5'-phosphate oxidase family protein [Mesorhizobium microcysteis]|uniref:Pyridoxamine 5'-phosphate oxidase family protein n=2 Tax=Neoaquamicrobium microcysteis TaxID=2682781 RepID=A0A5D4GV84_9HYPH|nr:pyridoxamine 5'-phosphate oxidase family protein [Mesorhizobium microcysteis]
MENLMSKSDRKKLYEMIDDIKIAMLTTVEKGGALHARPMANQAADKSGTLWFFTEKDGGVAKNVKANPRVSLGYAGSGAYVAVSGNAEMIHDRKKIDALWSEEVKAWFPDGKDDPNLALLKVDPEVGEYWSFPSAPVSRAIGYVKAKLTGEAVDDIGENKKLAL